MTTKNKKRVLIFIPEFSKLTESFILREVEQLVKNNVLDITVFSLQKGSAQISPEVKSKVVYKKIGLIDILLSLHFYFLTPLKILTIFKLILNNKNRGFISTLYLFIKSLGYATVIKKYHPDIIYSHFMSESSTMAYIVCKVLNLPLSISAHAKDVLQTNGPTKENVELIKLKSEYVNFVTVCNKNAYNNILNSIDTKYHSKIHLEYHGIDSKKVLEKFKLAKSINIDANNKLVLFTIGRFVEKKGFEYLIKAVKVLKDKNVDFVLFIAGAKGPLYQKIVSMINELGLNDNVKILGNGEGVDFDTIISYFKISDIFILPSVNTKNFDADGIPNVLIESAVFGVPIITTDAGSITEFLVNEQDALIVKQKDYKQIAEKIMLLNFNQKHKNYLVENANKKAITMFDINKNVQKIEDLLLLK